MILLPSTDSRDFAATVGYGASMSLFHRVEIGIGGTLALWSPQPSGIALQNGPLLLNVKGILFPLLRTPVPDSEFTFGLQLQQQLRIPHFDGLNDLGTETPLTALRAVADKPFWRMGITVSLGFLLTQGRTDSELSSAVSFHLPWTARATVQGFGVLQGLFGSKQNAPLRRWFRSVCSLCVGQRNVAQRRLHARSRRRNRTKRDLHRWSRLSHRKGNSRAVLFSATDSQP